MISCSRRRGKKKSWAVDRMWAKASGTVEFRRMVTDGRPKIKKIHFIPLWFRSGNIRCKWKPDHRMDGIGNKKANVLKFSFLGSAFFLFLKMSMADRFTCLCSARSFRGDASETSEKHAPNNHLSTVKKRRCLHLTTVNKATQKTGEKKGWICTRAHKEVWFQCAAPVRRS